MFFANLLCENAERFLSVISREFEVAMQAECYFANSKPGILGKWVYCNSVRGLWWFHNLLLMKIT